MGEKESKCLPIHKANYIIELEYFEIIHHLSLYFYVYLHAPNLIKSSPILFEFNYLCENEFSFSLSL
jgi:hypothetical protein